MHHGPGVATPARTDRPALRDLSREAVARRAMTVRQLDRTPCDVCGNAATLFVRCDAEDFRSFRCHEDMIAAAKAFHARGFEVRVEKLASAQPGELTTDATASVAAIVEMMEQQPFQFAVRFLSLERLVEELHARLGGVH